MPDQVRVDVPPPFEKAYLTIAQEGESIAQVALEAVELEDLITNLGRARSHFSDQVPTSMEPNQRSEAAVDPIWQVREPTALPFEGKALFLRHPGFGWLSFAIPRTEADSMGDALKRRH